MKKLPQDIDFYRFFRTFLVRGDYKKTDWFRSATISGVLSGEIVLTEIFHFDPTGSYEDMFYCDKQKEICLIMSGGQGLNFRVKMIYGKDESRKTNGFVLKLILCCNLGINPDQIFEIASINYIFHKTQGVWRSIKIEEISDGVEGLDLFGERFWSASGNDTFGVVQDKIRSWIVITLGSELQCSIRPA